MSDLSFRTKFANKQTVEHKWFIIDAEQQTLGRLASHVAHILRGKHKPSYSPHVNCGDKVIVLNSDKVHLSGKKWDDKEYITYSGYPGGQRRKSAKLVNAQKPTKLVEAAVKGMLPKNRLGSQIIKNLFVYEGAEHPHVAQQPETIKLS